MLYRPLANTGIQVSEIAMGCWPIAGMNSPNTNEADAVAAVRECFEVGINHLDTAYMYGRSGESERRIAQALGRRRGEMVIATKCGLHWSPEGQQMHDARPATLRRQCEESLRRLETDHVELLYLHAPDPNVPVAESAAALKDLMTEGKTRAVGVSNVTLAQLEQFAAVSPIAAYQPPYNMLQRQIEADTLPWCRRQGVSVMVYWPLLKGLLAGKLRRDQVFTTADSRHKYPMFQGEELQKNLDLVDRLREIASGSGHTVAQLVISWTIRQAGITAALCGAKRPEQLRETAAAGDWVLSPSELALVAGALADRGTPSVRSPV
jgi:aryl-alcohol dehydrogenase-like predicted oxidoreductase